MSVVCLREIEEGADDSVAPALQAAKEKLQRSQLEVSAPQRRQAELDQLTSMSIGQA